MESRGYRIVAPAAPSIKMTTPRHPMTDATASSPLKRTRSRDVHVKAGCA